jgi:hypothetical protein
MIAPRRARKRQFCYRDQHGSDRKPNTSKPAPGHKIYPYLLRGVSVDRPNQVWAMDITYVPMARGFVYLAAVVDWFSRRVLSWRLSITLEAAFCAEALEEALARHGRPEVFNTDQGSQLTSHAFTGVLLQAGVAINMDRKGSGHTLTAQVRQSVFGRLAGYEDVNDADRLGRDPAMRWIVGGRAVTQNAASTSQMGRFETEVLTDPRGEPVRARRPVRALD